MAVSNDLAYRVLGTVGLPAARRVLLLVLLGMGALPAGVAVADSGEPLVFGVFPWGRPSLVRTVFDPIAERIVKELGRPVRVRVMETYERFLTESAAGSFDLVYPPVSFMDILMKDYGFTRLVAFDPPPRPILCARKGDPIASLSGLRGKRLAMPPRFATVSLVVTDGLREAGLDPEEDLLLSWSSTHDSPLISLLIREADAAVTTPAMIQLLAQGLSEDLMIVHEFSSYARTEILLAPGFSAAEADRLRRALLDFSTPRDLPAEEQGIDGFHFVPPRSSSRSDIESFGKRARAMIEELALELPPPSATAR